MGAKGSFTWNVTVAVSAMGRAVVVFSEQIFSGKQPQSQLPRGGVLCFTPGLHEPVNISKGVLAFHPPEPH